MSDQFDLRFRANAAREMRNHGREMGDLPEALDAAADEIERLRAENATLRAELKTWHDFGRSMAQSGLNGLTIPVAESE